VEYFDRLWSQMSETAPELFEPRRAFLLSSVEQGDRVLDVGCGEGWFCAALAEAGVVNVVGVDVAAEAIRRARARHPQLRFEVCGESELPGGDCSFDVIWLGEVIEHVRDGLGLLAECARVLGPGGRLLLTTPDHDWRTRLRLGLSRRAFERHFEPRADHLRFFTRDSLRSLLEAAGFAEVAVSARAGVLAVSARAG
jgi:2-polyprenyl-3-methyl-5-hydroxy-6-metoxy-1,4-benzoquinol methylase